MKTRGVEIRAMEIEGMPIFVIDELFDELEVSTIFRDIESGDFTREEYDLPGDDHPIFSFEYDARKFETNHPVAVRTRQQLASCFPSEKHKLVRAYVNRCNSEDISYPHRDCVDYSRNVTALYYANPTWDYRWGGETKFYEKSDTRYAVLPHPGRIVVFRGAIEHMGSVPSQICHDPRYTLAMKYSSRVPTSK
jgi:Rps23 Pro-64 3,4-dihydroxylase Tpa1-like proline 4-hydroxylase